MAEEAAQSGQQPAEIAPNSTDGASEAAAAPAAPASSAAPPPAPSEPVSPSPSPGAGTGDSPELDSTASPPAAEQSVKAKEDWREKRLKQLTARLREQESRAGAPQVDAATAPPAADPAALQAQIRAEAERLAAAQRFADQCNQAVEAGKQVFGAEQFNARVADLRKIVDPSNPNEAASYAQMIEQVIETGEAPKLIYALGADLNLASELMELSPAKRAMRLAQLALAKGEPEPSAAPAPIKPITPKGETHTQISPADAAKADKLSTREWMARRQAEIDARRAKGERVW